MEFSKKAYKNDDVYILAMAVDPRYRLAILTDPAEVESATKKLKKEVHKAYHKSVKTNTSTQIASDPKLNQPQVSECQQSMIIKSTETTSVCQSSSNSVWDAVRERCTIYNLRCDFMDMQEILDIEVIAFFILKILMFLMIPQSGGVRISLPLDTLGLLHGIIWGLRQLKFRVKDFFHMQVQ
ncbi:uncharacterized protein [Temnothorax nylanderi]|uniref:uncharacterized protein n=1 Tax=Temnothorax nylanderi TaxID=102681 RepID=UPI003A855A22